MVRGVPSTYGVSDESATAAPASIQWASALIGAPIRPLTFCSAEGVRLERGLQWFTWSVQERLAMGSAKCLQCANLPRFSLASGS